MKELYSQTKDAAPSGNLARPAPPGRRRVSSRNVSRASSTASPHLASSSPSMASVATFQQTGIANLEDDDGEGIDRDAAKIPHISLQSDSDPTSEIPLEEVEVALAGMSREDLVLALKRAKEQMDIVRGLHVNIEACSIADFKLKSWMQILKIEQMTPRCSSRASMS